MALSRIQTAEIADNAITTAKVDDATVIATDIVDGTIVDSMVASGAAIAHTKCDLGTVAGLDVGTGANQIVQMDSTPKLPALNGSALTNLTAANLTGALPVLDGTALTGIVTDFTPLENQMTRLALHIGAVEQLAKYNMIDQVIDDYEDATGIVAENSVAAVPAIPNSCAFNHGDSEQMTQGSFQPSNAYTVSFWFKRGDISRTQYIYRINSADYFSFRSDNKIDLERRTGSLTTTSTYTSTSEWNHFLIKSTSTAFTLYVNGVQVGTNTSASNPYSAGNHYIGSSGGANYLNGYLTEYYWIDGLSLDPDSFGHTVSGSWKPKTYTGSYGSG